MPRQTIGAMSALSDFGSVKVVAIIPGHPAIRMHGDICRVELELVQVVQRVDSIQFTSVNQAHVDVADEGAFARFVKHGILPMQNRFLQRAFANIVIQRCARLAQE